MMNGAKSSRTTKATAREQPAGKSNHWGLTLLAPGRRRPPEMGKDVFEMIADFGRRGKIVDVHFRT